MLFDSNTRYKACEREEACRNEAVELVEQLEPFLLMESRIGELMGNEETRRAVEKMLHLIEEVSDYIRNKTSPGLVGMPSSLRLYHQVVKHYLGFLVGDGYKEKLEAMRKEFTKAKDDFDRSIQLETFKATDDTRE